MTGTLDAETEAGRFFPGWIVVGAAFVLLMANAGFIFYGQAVYLDALTAEQGFSTGAVSAGQSIVFVVGGLIGPLIGRLITERDVRIIVTGGLFLSVGSVLMLGRVETLWQLYLVDAVLGVVHGFSYLQSSDLHGALRQANEMLALSEREPIGYVLAGQALNQVGRHNEALLMFIEAHERSTAGEGQIRFVLDEAYLLRMVAVLCAKLGKLERAKIFIEEYLNTYPQDEDGQKILRRVNEKLGSRDEIPAG